MPETPETKQSLPTPEEPQSQASAIPTPFSSELTQVDLEKKQLKDSEGWNRPPDALGDSWFSAAQEAVERDIPNLNEGSMTYPSREDLIDEANLEQLDFIESSSDLPELLTPSVPGEGMGLLSSAGAGIHDGMVDAYSNFRTAFDAGWRQNTEVDSNGAAWFTNEPLTGRGERMRYPGTHFGWELARDPEGMMASFAHTGGSIGSGWFALRAVGAFNAFGKVNGAMKSAEVAEKMSRTQKLVAGLTRDVRLATQESLSAMITTPINQQGPLTSLAQFVGSWTGDEAEAYTAMLASEGPQTTDAIEHMANVFMEEWMLSFGLGRIFDAAFVPAKGYYNKAKTARIQKKLSEAHLNYRDKLAPKLKEAFDIKTKGIKDGVKNAEDLAVAVKELEEIMQNQDVLLLEATRLGLTRYVAKTKVGKLEAALKNAEAAGNVTQQKIINDKIKHYYDVQGGVGDVDDLAGTSRTRSESLLDDVEASSSYGHENALMAEKIAKTSNENLDKTLKKLKKAVKEGGADVMDKEISELMARNSIKISKDDILTQFIKDRIRLGDATNDLGIWTDADEGIFDTVQREMGISDKEMAQFRTTTANRPEAVQTLWLLRAKGKVARDDLVKWTMQARDTGDSLDIFRALHAYNKALSLTAITRKVSSLDGSSLQAMQWSLEAGEEMTMKVAAIKAKLGKAIDDTIDNGLLREIEANGELAAKLSKADKDTLTEMGKQVDIILAGHGGTKGALKVIDDIAKASAGSGDSLLADVFKLHTKSKFMRVSDTISGWAINNMLSAPTTIIKTAIGGAFQTVYMPMTRVLGGLSEVAVRGALRKANIGSVEDYAKAYEQLGDAFMDGMNTWAVALDSAQAGFGTLISRKSNFGGPSQNEFLQNVKTGWTAEAQYQMVKGEWKSLSTAQKAKGIAKTGIVGINNVVQVPTQNFMQGVDEFFKQLNFRASMRTSMMKQAKKAKLFDDPNFNFKEYYDTEARKQMAAQSTTKGQQAMEKALTSVFQKPLVGTGGDINWTFEGLNNVANKTPFMKLIFPFLKTMANMSDEFIESIPGVAAASGNKQLRKIAPIAHVLKRMNDRIMAPQSAWRKQQVLGKNIVFLGTIWGAIEALESGILQGGGEGSVQDRMKAREAGEFVPYSIQLGDKRYAFSELAEPLGMTFRIITRTLEAVNRAYDLSDQGVIDVDEAGNIINRAMKQGLDTQDSLMGVFIQETVDLLPLQGPTKAINAITRGGATMDSYLGDLMATMMPLSGFVGQTRRMLDKDYTIAKGWEARFNQKSAADWLWGPVGKDVEHGPVAVYDAETGKPTANYPMIFGFAGIKYNLNSNPVVADFFVANGPFVKTSWPTELQGSELTPSQQEEWQKEKFTVKINGKTAFESMKEIAELVKSGQLKDATTAISTADKKITPAVIAFNKAMEPYNKLADAKVLELNPSIKAAASAEKLRTNRIKSNQVEAKDVKALGRDLKAKGSVSDIKKAAQEILVDDPENAFNGSKE